jgi:ubiquinone/menaquinone biosynthesis C-methylase UbiE
MDPRIRSEVHRHWDDVLDREYHLVEDAVKTLNGRCCRFVDVGCGSRGLLGRKGDRLAALKSESWGIDVDHHALAENRDVAHRATASCYSLPFKSDSVDVIACRWVFEHLEFPEQAMAEFSRVLRTGGVLYIKTPNLFNYSMLLSWATPVVFHNLLRSANGHADNIPTFYRANTKKKLSELAHRSGFTVSHLEAYSYSYMYYSFNKELFLTMRTLSRLVGGITDNAHQTLLGVFKKGSGR